MDPRGIGLWDRQKLSSIEEAIWAMDYDEAGMHGYVSIIDEIQFTTSLFF